MIKGVAHRLANMAGLERLLRRRRERRVHRLSVGQGQGLRFSTGPAEAAYATGNNELPVQDCMARLLAPGDVFYDVGANVGFMTVLGAHLVGKTGLVYAFEPVPSNIRWVRRNVRLNGFENVSIIPAAVSNAIGTGELILAEYSGGSALSVAERPPDACGSIKVDLTTIDEMVRRGARPPGFVKIDVEGAEMEVLEGMRDTLEAHQPDVLFEVDGPDMEGVHKKAEKLKEFLSRRGYAVSTLEDAYPSNQWRVLHFLATPNVSTRQ